MMKCRMLNHPNKDAQILTVERISRPIFLTFLKVESLFKVQKNIVG